MFTIPSHGVLLHHCYTHITLTIFPMFVHTFFLNSHPRPQSRCWWKKWWNCWICCYRCWSFLSWPLGQREHLEDPGSSWKWLTKWLWICQGLGIVQRIFSILYTRYGQMRCFQNWDFCWVYDVFSFPWLHPSVSFWAPSARENPPSWKSSRGKSMTAVTQEKNLA